MAESAPSKFQGLGLSEASNSMRKEKERRKLALRNILGSDDDSDHDDLELIRDNKLAYGFDLRFTDYGGVTLVKSTWGRDYVIDLFGTLGLHCYNFQKQTKYEFVRVEKYYVTFTAYFNFYITLEAVHPPSSSPVSFQTLVCDDVGCAEGVITLRTLASRTKCGDEAVDTDWGITAIDSFYTGPMPQWMSDEDLVSRNNKYYVVQESELHANDWLYLFTQVAFFMKTQRVLEDSPTLEIKKVVVETKEECESEAREKLKAENALFYISYQYNGDSSTGWARDYKVIIRKSMDGNPGHMSLDIADRTEDKAEYIETYVP